MLYKYLLNSNESYINEKILIRNMEKNKLRQVIIDQQTLFNKKEDLIDRDIDLEYYLKGNEIIVISGITRCGKSSLLILISEILVPALISDSTALG